jgi:hypothetical protein
VRHKTFGIAAASIVAACALAACSHDSEGSSCFSTMVHGVVIYQPSIDLLVRDANGRGEAFGTKATVYRGSDSVVTTGIDTLHLRAGYTDAGSFKVRVSRPFYQDVVLPSVAVLPGQCNVLVTTVPVTLSLAPGAPAIRALAIFGTDFLYTPGVQLQLVARLDADPGIPTTVNWRVADTVLARIDANGLLTAKCTLVGGADSVTAISTADTTVRAKAIFGVAKQTACP